MTNSLQLKKFTKRSAGSMVWVVPRGVRKKVGFKLFSAGRVVHVQVERMLHSILRKEYCTSLEVGMQETCPGVGEACLVQLRTGEEGGMGLCTRAKGDVLSSRRKLSHGVLPWGERRLEWLRFRGGSCSLGSWAYHECHLSSRPRTQRSCPEILANRHLRSSGYRHLPL